MPRLNIGVVISVPEPYAAVLADWRKRVGDPEGERVPPHVTLLPPTAVTSAAVHDIERHLAAAGAAAEPFEVRLSGTGTFRPVSDVVFVVVAAGMAECERLEGDIRRGPLARETRFPYHPHVTVAHDIAQEGLDAAHVGLADFEARFTVSAFTMFEQGKDHVWYPRRAFALGSRTSVTTAGAPAPAAPATSALTTGGTVTPTEPVLSSPAVTRPAKGRPAEG